MKSIILNLWTKIKKQNNNQINYYILLIISIILMLPLISNKFFYGHDTTFHLSNIRVLSSTFEMFKLSKVIPLVGNDFGYGIYIFYPNLPHILTAILKMDIEIFGLNEIHAIKIVHFLCIYLSGVFMNILLKKIYKNNTVSLLGSIFYITMPYFLNDIYIRSALNETFLFVIMPIICIGLINLKENKIKQFFLYFVIGYIILINSHLVLALHFSIYLGIFLLMNYKEFMSKEKIKYLFIAALIIIVEIFPSVIMILEHKALNIYKVFDIKEMYIYENLKTYTLSWKDLLLPPIKKNYIFCFINISVLISMLISLIYYIKEKKKTIKSISLIIILLMILLLTTNYDIWTILPKTLLLIQFPMRNMTYMCFILAILSPYFIMKIKTKYQKTALIVLSLLCITTSVYLIYNRDYESQKDIFYSINEGINDGMGHYQEYLPINLAKVKTYLYYRKPIVSANKKVEITMHNNQVPLMEFEIELKEKGETKLELPRIYYLGYEILYNDGKKTKKLNYKCNEFGLIEIKVPNNGNIKVEYKGTRVYRISNAIRLIINLVGLIYLLIKKTKNSTILLLGNRKSL